MDDHGAPARFEDPALARRVARVESWLREVYRLDLALEAARFLLCPQVARGLLPPGSPRSGVVLQETRDDLWLGLYLDPEDHDDTATILEETSHLPLHRLACQPAASSLAAAARAAGRRGPLRPSSASTTAMPWGTSRGCSGACRPTIPSASTTSWPTTRRVATASGSPSASPERGDIPALLGELRGFYRAGPDHKLRGRPRLTFASISQWSPHGADSPAA